MLPVLISWFQALNDPAYIVWVAWGFVFSYYVASAFFLRHAADANYVGPWRKNGPIDYVTSFLWSGILIFSLVDLLIRNELPLGYVLTYYVLFVFLFAFIYAILDWHFPGTLHAMRHGWAGELQVLVMSVEIMTSSPYTSAKPEGLSAETLSAVQSLLALLLVAVFIAKTIAALAPLAHQ